ncbi:hypothetical protein Cabys_2510 [Caldithrix abyssi DSM 13497]|uniref:Uncharacterized protein n=1 Tax=Caldithrix abyssi DSM 13497 TaxID=880073 RepID=A0A1J1C973_CALAY|nr:hypothetical protein Cabys_2510 [Caldithrix abyssi DSM 13497]
MCRLWGFWVHHILRELKKDMGKLKFLLRRLPNHLFRKTLA